MEVNREEQTSLKEKIVAMIEFMRSEKNTPTDVSEELMKIIEHHYGGGKMVEALMADVKDESSMIDHALKIAEYNFISANYRELYNAKKQFQMILATQKMKGDIKTSAQLQRVEHDLGLLAPLVQELGIQLTRMIEAKYGFQFKFLCAVDKVN